MKLCRNCKKNITFGSELKCPNCNAYFCTNCANENKNICPYCYSSLEFNN